MKGKLLFVCSANMMRSPTAAALFVDSPRYEAKSAGILPESATRLTQQYIDWADQIFLMSEKEDRHLTYVREHFDISNKMVEVLEIPNVYERDDPRLIALLRQKLARFL